jgi:hypothetical protein
VNIGYSIGWNNPPTPRDTPTLIFSIGFEFIGSSAVAYALQIFAECILLDDRAWYLKALKREQIAKDRQSDSWKVKVRSWVESQSENLIPFCACLFWLTTGAIVAWRFIDQWTPFECIYFAFSSLATGGQQEIPSDSPTDFFLAGSPLLPLSISFSFLTLHSRTLLRHRHPPHGIHSRQCRLSLHRWSKHQSARGDREAHL